MYMPLPHQPLAIALPPDQLRIDPVLGVPDRHGLGLIIEQVQQQRQRTSLLASYFVVGLDRLQELQQAFGITFGQTLLHETAHLLRRHLADRAHLCWLGGDMFAVVLLHDTATDTAAQAQSLLARFRANAWPQDAHVTVSIGAVALDATMTPDRVIVAGEQALREAKNAGRNLCYTVTHLEPDADAADALLTARQVQRALQEQSLYLVFQPVVDSRTNTPLFYEALVRMKDQDGRPVAAARFMPAVEKYGLSYLLDCHVLALAVSELKQHPGLQLAINVAAQTTAHPAWTRQMEGVFADRRDLAARLIIEITETSPLHDIEQTRSFVDRSQALGSQVAIDDFGAGHTSLLHLTGLPVRLMKIDRSLVQDVMADPRQQEVLLAIIALARSLKLRVVAEGVEHAALAQWLRDAGVDMQQGYHHGYPLPDRPWLAA
jgi:diguanylate cyclase (GGDEF)-like protein